MALQKVGQRKKNHKVSLSVSDRRQKSNKSICKRKSKFGMFR